MYQTPRLKRDLCLTNLYFGLSLSILRADESSSQSCKLTRAACNKLTREISRPIHTILVFDQINCESYHRKKLQSILTLDGSPSRINVCQHPFLTCCNLCTSSSFGFLSSLNHGLSYVIIDQSPFRIFYHTY